MTYTSRQMDDKWYTQAGEEAQKGLQDWTKEALRENLVDVTFTKADGTTRIMKCTLNESFGAQIPVNNTSTTERKVNPDICSGWDTEKQAWRSFRWDRLRKVEIIQE